MSNYKISEHSKKQALLLEANKEQIFKKIKMETEPSQYKAINILYSICK